MQEDMPYVLNVLLMFVEGFPNRAYRYIFEKKYTFLFAGF